MEPFPEDHMGNTGFALLRAPRAGRTRGHGRAARSTKPPVPGWGVRLHSHPPRWGAPHRPGPCGSGGHLPSTPRGGSLDSEGEVRPHFQNSRAQSQAAAGRAGRAGHQVPDAAPSDSQHGPRQLSPPPEVGAISPRSLGMWCWGPRAGDRHRGPSPLPPTSHLPSPATWPAGTGY